MQRDNVCISWPSEENADRYMITYQKSTQRNTKKTKFVTDSKYCFTDEDGLIENNDYTVELSPFAGPNGGPKSSFTFFLNYENTDQGSDFTVVPTDSNLPDVQIEDPEELARLGREWTRSYFRWHTLTFSKWIRALNQYVPYLAKKIGADNLRDADAVCPMKVVPKQCQKISTVTDHNGCEFHYCDAENSLVEGKFFSMGRIAQLVRASC